MKLIRVNFQAQRRVPHHATIKARRPGAVLFYRHGDFCEMYFDDALTCSKVLGLTLHSISTEREGKVPMRGIPSHTLTAVTSKMIQAGFPVALCEQVGGRWTGTRRWR